ncbi:hypothetical protein ACFX2J_022806 [Malus domestica]
MCSTVALQAQGKLAATSSASMAEKKTETLGTSPESFPDLQRCLSLRSPLTSPTASITSTTASASTPPSSITTSRAPASSSAPKYAISAWHNSGAYPNLEGGVQSFSPLRSVSGVLHLDPIFQIWPCLRRTRKEGTREGVR